MIDAVRRFFGRAFGAVRLRQLLDRLRHRLSFVPILYVIASIVLVQLVLLVDRDLTDRQIPIILTTTVDSARAVFAAIAGALITSITLLLSMMLVTIQLASSQFSPRVVRDWLGNRTLQHTIGLVLASAVFSLLGLRSTRSFGEGTDEIVPHATVLVAVLLGVMSLVAVVRSVDHITQSVRIGSVAKRITNDTIDVIRATTLVPPGTRIEAGDGPGVPTARAPESARSGRVQAPASAAPIEAPTSGWVQQIDDQALLRALPDQATGWVVAQLGAFTTEHSPLMWIDPAPPADHPCRRALHDAFAIGDTRTLQQDVAFGIVQLTDIAVRALSPGVNDPGTASDIIVHLGDVMAAIWENSEPDAVREQDGRTLVRRQPTHRDHLERAFGPIRRYGAADPEVIATLLTTLRTLESEVERRDLQGPLEPIADAIRDVSRLAQRDTWSAGESWLVDELAGDVRGG